MPNPLGNRVTQREKNGYDRRKQKIPFERRGKAPPKPKHPRLPAHVLKQKKLRPVVAKICEAAGLTQQSEHKRGTDYTFRFQRQNTRRTVKIDFKYCFGGLGPETIQTRLKNIRGQKRGELINNAKWMMAFDGKNTVYFFQTSVIDAYLKRCWGRISKQHAVNKGSYTEYPVNLSDVFWQLKVTPIKVDFSVDGVRSAIKQIKDLEIPRALPAKPNRPNTPYNPAIIKKNDTTLRPQINRTGTRGK
ncbi:MAG: hypothetical protein HOE11_05130 [Candidatus Diapherotrites archaeon]|nr:hypothetical protein [Candidatus Diapherotrites archaeon]MBT4596564.1 hypothetical protein [Candidatus Diapherotrites archaeon]